MDLGEGIVVATILVDKHKKETCPFCAEDDPQPKTNDLANSASKLGTACKKGDIFDLPEPCSKSAGSAQWCVVYQHPKTDEEDISEVRSNPHHCIPGKASLKGEYEHPILEAMEKAKNTITGDIGYNVNGKPNGIWLPTIIEHFYSGYTNVDPVAGISWGQLSKEYPTKQFSMAEAAMYETNRQFHDAHPDYNEHVKGRLDKLFNKLILRKMQCPEAGPKSKPDVPPPYGLVDWLDALSSRMAKYLSCPPKQWKDPIFTSRHAKAFYEKIK
jgi:hypothetical protein